jgi:hypothetical protein
MLSGSLTCRFHSSALRFDINLLEVTLVGQRVPPRVTDHSELILTKLKAIGFEFEVKAGTVRIWGYLPKCYEDFPPT